MNHPNSTPGGAGHRANRDHVWVVAIGARHDPCALGHQACLVGGLEPTEPLRNTSSHWW